MKILLTGGGTGGHIMPLFAVAEQLKAKRPDCVLVYVGERHGKFSQLTDDSQLMDEHYSIWAGKFRRYQGLHWWQRWSDIPTFVLNVRDFGYFLIGSVQAWFLLRRTRPDVVFLKGGFVGVPVGIAAGLRRIPIVTHDSDAMPGLANRLVSRWVSLHAVALPVSIYHDYPLAKLRQVGVLVEAAYVPVTPELKVSYRTQLQLPVEGRIVLVTGGSLGAEAINKTIVSGIDALLDEFPDLVVVHQVGKGKRAVYGSYVHERLRVLEFLQPMHVYMGAADVVVARGSANTLAELGVQGKASIVVPSPYLAGGHQLKNATILEEQGSALVVTENQLYDVKNGLTAVLQKLLPSKKRQNELATRLHQNTIRDAAGRLSEILIAQADISSGNE